MHAISFYVHVCVCVSIDHGDRAFGQKNCTWGERGRYVNTRAFPLLQMTGLLGSLVISQLMWCHLLVAHPSSVNITVIPIESHCKICNSYCRITYIFLLDYRSTGFLAYLTADVYPASGFDPILFDMEEYDYGNNYNPLTGIYTVPLDGLYLIHSRLHGSDQEAGIT